MGKKGKSKGKGGRDHHEPVATRPSAVAVEDAMTVPPVDPSAVATRLTGAAVLLIRLAQDYIINPHVMGGAVGLSPLIVMTNAIAVTTLFGPFYVLLSVPIASLVVTVIDVTARGVDPAEAEVPAVLFPAGDTET
jgi:hypothetical protein